MRRFHALLIAAGLAAASTSAVAGPSPDPKTGAPAATATASVTDKSGKPLAGADADRHARATDGEARRSVMDAGPGWLRAMLRPLLEARDRASSQEARHQPPATPTPAASSPSGRGDG